MNDDKVFRLDNLTPDFWNTVIFLYIVPSSGHYGHGFLWMITENKEQYFISFEAVPLEKIAEICPLLEKRQNINDYEHPYAIEDKGWKYLPKERVLLRDDCYENFMNVYVQHSNHPLDVSAIVRCAFGLERTDRYTEENTYLLHKQEEQEAAARKEESRKIALTKEDFIWHKILPSELAWGEYALLFSNEDGKVSGYKFTLLYQRSEISPLQQALNAPIECYVLLEQRLDEVYGPLGLCEDFKEKDFPQAFDTSCTLSNDAAYSYGDFVRAFQTIEEAKDYAVAVANIRGYANKRNIVTDADADDLMYQNWRRKYRGILAFREHYEEILKIVCDYRFKDHCFGGGRILNEIARTVNIPEELLPEIWKYVPLILTPQTQEKAAAIVRECEYKINKEDL